jgi:transcriptional regulator with XRE-family HTH domain
LLNTILENMQNIHHGKNVKKVREIIGMKQETLATKLEMTQQAISQLEQKEIIDQAFLKDIAKAMNVSTDIIERMTEDAANNFINTFNDTSAFNYQCTFNPLEKYVEAIEENKRLYEELLKAEKEKFTILQEKFTKKGS